MNTNIYQFDHDNIGNRVAAEFPDHQKEYDSDNQNAYTAMWTYNPSFTHDKYVFDLDGNMLTNQIKYSSDVWAYTWNGENRMTSATNTADGTYVTYKYDYQGRMISKNTSHGGTETRRDFIWNNNHIIQELITNESQLTTNLYTWANGETLTASLDGETVFYCHDANKNVTDLVDDSGTHLVHYDYSPFGVQNFTIHSSPFTVSLNPFRFSNEYFDATTGQVEFLNRRYLPQLGKFMSRDPIGVQGGLNETAICANDCVNDVDLWGLSDGISIPVDDLSVYSKVSVKYSRIEIKYGNALQGALEGIVLGPFAQMASVSQVEKWKELKNGDTGSIKYDRCKSLIVLIEVLPTDKVSWNGTISKVPDPFILPYVSSESNIRSRKGWSVINRESLVGPITTGQGTTPGVNYNANQLWRPMGAGSALSAWNPFTDAGGTAADWISLTDPASIGLNANNPVSYLEIHPMKKGWGIFSSKLSTYNLWVENYWVAPASLDVEDKLKTVFKGKINVR
jgi:RHS repeat-associated protein